MQHLEVRGAVRPLKWSLGVKWLMKSRVLLVFKTINMYSFIVLSPKTQKKFPLLCAVGLNISSRI